MSRKKMVVANRDDRRLVQWTPQVDAQNGNNSVECKHLASFKSKRITFSKYRLLYRTLIEPDTPKRRCIKAQMLQCNYKDCLLNSRLHLCLSCMYVACFKPNHIGEHHTRTGHSLAMDLYFGHIYCFHCQSYIYDQQLEDITQMYRKKKYSQTDTLSVSMAPEVPGLRGLINLGSTCFMNCILQTFVHTPIMRDYFLSDMHHCTIDSSQCLVCEMCSLVQEFFSGKTNAHIPQQLLHLVWSHAAHLAGYDQQDAHEFFISALDILHRHSSGNTGFASKTPCNCFVDKIFSGSLQSDVVCQSCGGVSSKVDPIWDFSLDLVSTHFEHGQTSQGEPPKSLIDCLTLFTRTEYLGSSVKCSKCKSYQESTKKLSLLKLPMVASFHLKRFEQTADQFNKKISTYISFPICLDMTPFTSNKIGHQASERGSPRKRNFDETEEDNNYQLFAVVNHSGNLDSGHYTVFVRKGLNWFKCDDNNVTKATEEQVLLSEGYLLFYHRSSIPSN